MAVCPLEQMIGKQLLVGVSYLARDGSVREQLQFAGEVLAVEPLVSIYRGEDLAAFTLPPAEDAFDPAPPGEYRLRGAGEVIVDPDFITSWTVHPADSDEAK